MNAAMIKVLLGLALAVPLATAGADGNGRGGYDPDPSVRAQARTSKASAQVAQPLPLYIPPLRGAPASRVGGASRGATDARVTLDVLAPEHTGLTISAQPSLYWYLSEPVTARLEFTVIGARAIKPLAEIVLPAPESPGIQGTDLARHGINLKPGVDYQWFVTLVPDPKQRSSDILAGGTIRHVAPSAALNAKLDRADEQRLAHVYAGEGLWYDAIAALCDSIEERRDDAPLRAQRAALLKQVGLGEVAARDVNFASYESVPTAATR